MQLEFQVIKDGDVLFKSSVAETLRNRLPEITSRALNEFTEKSPSVSLTEVTLKWETVPSEC